MQASAILVCTDDPAAAANLARVLRADGAEVLVAPTGRESAELLSSGAVDLAIVDACAGAGRVLDVAAHAGVTAIALAPAADAAALVELLCDRELEHVVRCGPPRLRGVDLVELVATVGKLAGRELFGLDAYVPAMAGSLRERELVSASERDDVVAEVREYLIEAGARRRVASALATVADELVTNAIYNAPRDAAGRPRFAHVDRRDKVSLESHERVRIRYATDGDRFALSVTDGFGSLTADDLRRSLRRCLGESEQIEQKVGGAGIGLYTTLMACDQLVFNLAPRDRAEVIALARLAPAARAAGEGHSVHVFSRAAADPAVAAPRRVALSDSMRNELRRHFARGESGGRRRPERPTSWWELPVLASSADDSGAAAGAEPVANGELDRVLAAIEHAGRGESAVAAGASFLARHYRAVAVYRHQPGGLRPCFAAGSTASWLAPAQIEQRLAEQRASGQPLALSLGAVELVMPVRDREDVSYVLCGVGPREGHHPEHDALTRLHLALEHAVARAEAPYVTLQQVLLH